MRTGSQEGAAHFYELSSGWRARAFIRLSRVTKPFASKYVVIVFTTNGSSPD